MNKILNINSGTGVYDTSPDWHWEGFRSLTDDFDLWFIRGGEGQIVFNDSEEYYLSCGACFIIPPGCGLKAVHEPHNPIKALAVYFDYLRNEAGRLSEPYPRLYRQMQSNYLMEQLMLLAILEWGENRHESACVWLNAALLAVNDEDIRGTGFQAPYQEAVTRFCDAVRNDPARPFMIRDIAEKVHLNPDSFTRIFRNFTGQTPKHFIVRTRIEKAKGLLLSSNLSCARIGELCGFEDASYFHRQFVTTVGMTPQAFRRIRAGKR